MDRCGLELPCDVVEAETGEDGLLRFREGTPDVVVLDFHLPDMNGLEFLGNLVYEAGADRVPVVMLTGTGSEDIAVEAMKNGAQDYLLKGNLSPERLRRAIRQAVDKVQMIRELEAHRLELEQKNQELQQASAAKDEFLAMLAHELRNPLAASRNAVELIKRLGQGDERFHQAVETLQRQVRHQGLLLDDLLDVSRITRGKILLRPRRVDLAELVRNTAQDHQRALEDGGLTLKLETPEAPVWICGDPMRLGQTLDNLLHNALKFTDAGGSVEVSVLCRSRDAAAGAPDRAVITIRDTGIGITREMLPLLFDTFAQADRTLDRSRGGLGLGLAVVRGLIALHDGTVTARSDGPGRGAEFVIELPLTSEAAAPEAVPAEPSPNSNADELRVLIVEDNRDAAETLRDLLELSGFQVEIAYNGTQGVEAAHRFAPDVVLCDLGLPGMDGYEVARCLREDPGTAGARLIAISGYGQAEDRLRSLEAGFDLHLTKPVDPAEVERLLTAVPGE
ncbi:MAG: hypothetical protein K0Q72_1669 [Armatimonadetes bacterium]|nr:hypothetical protein [Armatimonadota bacterium]